MKEGHKELGRHSWRDRGTSGLLPGEPADWSEFHGRGRCSRRGGGGLGASRRKLGQSKTGCWWGPASGWCPAVGGSKSGELPHWLGSLHEPHAPCPHPLQANETFAFIGNVTHHAWVWLNISAEIRSFLEQGRLQQHLHWLQQVLGGPGAGARWGGGGGEPTLSWASELAFHPQYVAELRLHPEALNLSLEELPPALRQDNFSLPNGSALLQQLDTIDNAACGWIQFMSKVGWASLAGPHWYAGLAPTMPLPTGERRYLQGFS